MGQGGWGGQKEHIGVNHQICPSVTGVEKCFSDYETEADFFFFFVFSSFLGPHSRHMEVPRLGI